MVDALLVAMRRSYDAMQDAYEKDLLTDEQMRRYCMPLGDALGEHDPERDWCPVCLRVVRYVQETCTRCGRKWGE